MSLLYVSSRLTGAVLKTKMCELAQAKGAQVVQARVVGTSFNKDSEPTIESVTILNNQGHQAVLPCTDLVVAAGPWSGDLSAQILPADLNLRPIPITSERAHSIILQAHGRLTPHAVFSRIYDQGRTLLCSANGKSADTTTA